MCQLITFSLTSLKALAMSLCTLVGLVLLWMNFRQQHSEPHDGIRIARYMRCVGLWTWPFDPLSAPSVSFG